MKKKFADNTMPSNTVIYSTPTTYQLEMQEGGKYVSLRWPRGEEK